MKSLGKPWYTQSQYDQASAVYMRYCCDQALHEGRPMPTQPAKLPLMRPRSACIWALPCYGCACFSSPPHVCSVQGSSLTFSCGWHFPWETPYSRRTLLPASVRHGRHRFPGATCRTGHIPFPWNINLLQLRKMVSTRNHHLLKIRLNATTKRMVIRNLPAKTLNRH